MPDGGFDVDPEEIDAHAKQVEDILTRLKTAIDADNNRVDAMSFGAVGVACGLYLWCNSTADRTRETLETAVKSGEHHVDAVHTWAKARRVDEQTASDLLKQSGTTHG
ncbi:hypothetical protein [Amycolatopsis sp. NPDC059657]|uniref:hypothetical protein n=1 Tax=Amycolatopsis sp. NPDC059657 TaxID=3346899 RepID=UPI00366E7F4E